MISVSISCIYLLSTVASRAILMYMPFSAWRKYAALGSVSTSTLKDEKEEQKIRISKLNYSNYECLYLPSAECHLISLTLGRGCITTIFFLATVMMWGVRMNWPKHWQNNSTDAVLFFHSANTRDNFVIHLCSCRRRCARACHYLSAKCKWSGLTALYSSSDANLSFWILVM